MSAITPFNPSGVRLGDITLSSFDEAERFSKLLVSSGVLSAPELRNPAAVFALSMKGAELGVPPMAALNGIHVIKGKPTISPELMRALALRAGHKVRVRASNTEATVTIVRADDPEPQPFTFTMDDAQQAGLLGNPSWKKYPRAMLVARATSEAMRAVCPDVLMGASYTPEELGAEVELGDDGEMVVVTETVRDDNPGDAGRLVAVATAKKRVVAAADDRVDIARDVWDALQLPSDKRAQVAEADVDEAVSLAADMLAAHEEVEAEEAGGDDVVDAEVVPDGPDFDAAGEDTDGGEA